MPWSRAVSKTISYISSIIDFSVKSRYRTVRISTRKKQIIYYLFIYLFISRSSTCIHTATISSVNIKRLTVLINSVKNRESAVNSKNADVNIKLRTQKFVSFTSETLSEDDFPDSFQSSCNWLQKNKWNQNRFRLGFANRLRPKTARVRHDKSVCVRYSE